MSSSPSASQSVGEGEAVRPVELSEIRGAQARLAGSVIRTPLMRIETQSSVDLYAKLENLQPIGSFKLRGAGNAMALAADAGTISEGVYTASAGNMAQGVAWNAKRLGVPCSVVVPDDAPRAKIDAIERLGARVIPVPRDRWWRVMAERHYPGVPGLFIHPFADAAVIAGNGTIGLEIVDELPDVAAVVVPFGGGGLSTGIASAAKALRPTARIFAAEVETAAPLAASIAAGFPQEVDYAASWVDGIGSGSLLPEMWRLVSNLLDGSIVVPPEAVADAVRLLASHRVVAEGAGAASLAAALTGRAGDGPVVAVVSGGNIDPGVLASILVGGSP